VLAPVACEVPVVAIDHRQAGAHVAGRDRRSRAGAECEGGERVAEIVDPAPRRDPDGGLCGHPSASAKVVQIEGAAPQRREHHVCLCANWEVIKRFERNRL